MQFIEFKEEHFTKDDTTGDFFIQIPKVEVGFGEVEVHAKQEDGHYSKADYEVQDELSTVTIRMKKPCDIRVNF